MAQTLNSLIAEARNLIGDLTALSYEYADAQLTDFINQAIRDLSMHFPRFGIYDVSTTAGTHIYDLETIHTGIISCEYPAAQDPPVFLKRRSFLHPDFWIQDGYYDFIKPGDADSANPPQLYLSTSPAASETITLKVTTEHDALSTGSDSVTLQDRHCHLIGLFVRWKCWQELSIQEGIAPGPLSTLTFTFETNAKRAEEAYRASLQAAIGAESESVIAKWRMDKFDRLL